MSGIRQVLGFLLIASSAYHAMVHPNTRLLVPWAGRFDEEVFALVHSIPVAMIYLLLLRRHHEEHKRIIVAAFLGILAFPFAHGLTKGPFHLEELAPTLVDGLLLGVFATAIPAMVPLLFGMRRSGRPRAA